MNGVEKREEKDTVDLTYRVCVVFLIFIKLLRMIRDIRSS